MEQVLKWEYAENNLAKKPIKGMFLYLVRGYVIEQGLRRNQIRLTRWSGSKWDDCDDMIVEMYSQVTT